MKKIILVVSLFLILGCNPASPPLEKGSVEWLYDLALAKNLAASQEKPILIDFYTDWCGWCKRMDAETYADAKVSDKAKQFICVKIDADAYSSIAKDYNVRGFPTTVFLNSQAEVLDVVPGYLPPDQFLILLDRILSAE